MTIKILPPNVWKSNLACVVMAGIVLISHPTMQLQMWIIIFAVAALIINAVALAGAFANKEIMFDDKNGGANGLRLKQGFAWLVWRHIPYGEIQKIVITKQESVEIWHSKRHPAVIGFKSSDDKELFLSEIYKRNPSLAA